MAVERIVLVWIVGLTCWTQGAKVNIALKKPAWTNLRHLNLLISGHYANWTADKAVDGDTDISRQDKTCFHAHGSPSDWTVDLEDEYQLYDIRVYIWNFTSTSWKSRTANSIIYLDNNTSRVCYTFPPATGILKNPIDVTCNDTGRNVTIRNPGTGPIHANALNLCEVEIYVCSHGTYGINCTDSCHCTSPPCDRWTGVCSGDCTAGYRGNKCDAKCMLGTKYGANCENSCNARRCRMPSSPCDRETGQCTGGCQDGWGGVDCTRQCTLGTNYGANCAKSCFTRRCRTSSSYCDRETGQCTGGCQDGWGGVDCTSRCPEGTFGLSCLNCSIRYCEGESDCPADGTCSGGCQDGWTLDTCTQACPSGTYGPGCSSTCGKCTGDNICNHLTGSCPGDCKPGWRGRQCKDTCTNGKYGVNCKENCGQCNGTCDVVDGHCPGGCVDGYCGTQCQIKLEGVTVTKNSPGQDTVTIGVIGALIGAVLMFVVCGGICLCLMRCGRLRWEKSSDHQNQITEMDDVTSQQVISETVSERPQSEAARVYNNDYDVLDMETKWDNKGYDVIMSKEYQNT